MLENKFTIEICGLTIAINQNGARTILDIPDYRTREEMEKVIEEAIKKHNNGK